MFSSLTLAAGSCIFSLMPSAFHCKMRRASLDDLPPLRARSSSSLKSGLGAGAGLSHAAQSQSVPAAKRSTSSLVWPCLTTHAWWKRPRHFGHWIPGMLLAIVFLQALQVLFSTGWEGPAWVRLLASLPAMVLLSGLVGAEWEEHNQISGEYLERLLQLFFRWHWAEQLSSSQDRDRCMALKALLHTAQFVGSGEGTVLTTGVVVRPPCSVHFHSCVVL